jgi:lipopolysaccharide/colanic/teichoic acid biosynthesis glycosyltransferase
MAADVLAKETNAVARDVKSGLPRWVEVIFASWALVLASPVIAMAAVGIAVSSGWPIFFRQKRVGQHGETFELYKLRSMAVSAGGPEITSSADSRITPLGRFLRHTKIDELPTLWNVVRGDMSLVGPRPEVPRFVQLTNPTWQKVLAVKPGITDPMTLKLRSESELLGQVGGDTEEYYATELQPVKLKGYVAYLEKRTWRSDLKVLLGTAAAVLAPAESSRLTVEAVRHLATPDHDLNGRKS